jgi:hypothetical protein
MVKLIKMSSVIFLVLLVLLLGIGSIQANDNTDIDNVTQDGASIELDSEDKNVVQEDSSVDSLAKSDVDSDNFSADSLAQSEINQNNPSSNAVSKTKKGVGKSSSVKSYDSLQYKINHARSGSVVKLDCDYKFKSSDKCRYISIQKNIKVVGNGHSIDGAGIVRGFDVKGNCKVVLENVLFKNCYSEYKNGAALYAGPGASLTIKNCIFKNNKVYNVNGGAVYGNEYTKIDIHNSKFLGNSAIRKSNLEWNYFKKGMGSAVLMNIGSTLKIYNSVFKGNKAYAGIVLVVSYNDVSYSLSKLYIKNCRFEKNSASRFASVYLDEFGKGTVAGSVFKNNKVAKGGSILKLEASKYVLVKNCKFEKNSAPEGTIRLGVFGNTISKVKVVGSTFKGNKATSGAAIFSDSGILKISKCKFYNNIAKKKGGAVSTNKRGSLKIYKSIFKANKAKYGGAVYAPLKNVVSSKNKFSKNVAKKRGNHVFGRVYAKISKVSVKHGKVKLKVKLTSPWKIMLKQKFRLTVKGSEGTYHSKVLKTNSKGKATGVIKGKVPPGKYKVSLNIPSADLHFTKLNLKV